MAFLDFHPISPISTLLHTFLLISTTSTLFQEGALRARRACFLAISDPYPYGIAKGRKGARGIIWIMRLAPDGAYKGRLHVAWPFIGRKTLTERQKEYNDVHGFYRARIEHLFACMWHGGIVRNMWRGSGTELHECARVLLHLQQFFDSKTAAVPSLWVVEHVPAHVWTAPIHEDNDDEDVVGDDGDVCAFCCTKFDPEKMSMCALPSHIFLMMTPNRAQAVTPLVCMGIRPSSYV